MKKLVLTLILGYKTVSNVFHQILGIPLESGCRYTPTCSQYAYQAVQKYGAINGLYLGFRRILRCHPWAKGGHDPII